MITESVPKLKQYKDSTITPVFIWGRKLDVRFVCLYPAGIVYTPLLEANEYLFVD